MVLGNVSCCLFAAERAVRTRAACGAGRGSCRCGQKRGHDLGIRSGSLRATPPWGRSASKAATTTASSAAWSTWLPGCATGPNNNLISSRAKLAVEDIADTEEFGAVSLKGFHAPVAAFNVVGLRSES